MRPGTPRFKMFAALAKLGVATVSEIAALVGAEHHRNVSAALSAEARVGLVRRASEVRGRWTPMRWALTPTGCHALEDPAKAPPRHSCPPLKQQRVTTAAYEKSHAEHVARQLRAGIPEEMTLWGVDDFLPNGSSYLKRSAA
jgi:DNA-binding transcriptional ArsR family regulator